MHGRWWFLVFLLVQLLYGPGLALSDEENASLSAESTLFFESRIRPVLIEHCYECHSEGTEASGGLLLDSRNGWHTGGDSGPAIAPGDAEASLLIQAISYSNPRLQMPPERKLDDSTIADFRNWIEQGASDPREHGTGSGQESQMASTGVPRALRVDQAQQHWSYRPLTPFHELAIPSDLPYGAGVDQWIDQELAARGVPENDAAAPATLARRLYFDLIGLPPNEVQLEEAVGAIENGQINTLVDTLLASPHFGEVQARRWMDVVRYADSITLRGFILPQAWRYRDYLVKSFNQDASYQLMIRQQLAGDLMNAQNLEDRADQLVATGFLALGNTNLEEQDKSQLEMDYLDEQLDVIGSAFLGQTIGCARCHDHKFDPIPTRDYYALAGILRSSVGMKHANVSEWIELPLPLEEEKEAHYFLLEQQRKSLEDEIRGLKAELEPSKSGSTMIAVEQLPGIIIDNVQAKLVGKWTSSTHTRPYVGTDYIHDSNESKGLKSATFEPKEIPPGEYEVRLAYQAGANRASHVVAKVFSADGDAEVQIDQRKKPTEDGLWVSLGRYRFEQNGQAYVLISNDNTQGHVILDAVQFLPIDVPVATASQALAQSANSQSPTDTESLNNSKQSEIETARALLRDKEKQLSSIKQALQERPRYLTVQESGSPTDLAIHLRGSVHTLGEVVPRGFLTAVVPPSQEERAGIDANVASSLSSELVRPDRLDLANWIADPQNPLTARVYVNRIWLWFMGQGIVNTPNNFGTTGQLPTHPELLDWLAWRFIRSDWSTKEVIREIVLSQAYQRASDVGSLGQHESDPENLTYWRGQVRRLPVEALRDAMLMVSGELDASMGGSIIRKGISNDFDYSHGSIRRSIYQPVFRNSLPELYEQFDFADPSVSMGQRAHSTIAMQGLSLANNPWVNQRASQAARRWEKVIVEAGWERALERLYIACLGRPPSHQEMQLTMEYASKGLTQGKPDPIRMELLIQTLFSSLDFRFLE